MICDREPRAGIGAIAVLLIGCLMPAIAQSSRTGPAGFKSPSNNIHCQYFDGELRCDIMKIANPLPPKPRDCELDWGQAFAVATDSRSSERLCHGDTAADPGLPTLPYGSTWRHGSFTCTSEQTGVTCTNTLGHGFALSRSIQRLF